MTVAASTFEWVQVVGGTVAALAALATIAGKNSDPETASTLSRSETCSTLRAVADDTHATPEEAAEAAFSDIPSKYVRVESVSYSDDDTAVVTLLMNEEPYLYPYYVHCVRDDSGRWSETFSSNWALLADELQAHSACMTRLCAACETPLPADARPNRPYCDRRCRANAYAARQRAARTALVVELPVRDGALAEQTLVQAIERAAADPWRAAAWLLERRWPERWSTSRKPPTASGDVDEFDPFAEVDQIAEQRRKRLPTPLT